MATYHLTNKPHSVTRDGVKIDTAKHYKYISREGTYAHIRNKGEDLQYKASGNLPKWADESPAKFWKEAESNRRANGRAFRELELGLQEELSLDANIECVEELMRRTGIADNHVWSYAIHKKPALFEKDHYNIHAHLMFNERILEKDRPLETPEEFFKRYSTTDDGEKCGGYKTERKYSTKEFTYEVRQIWEDIVNEKLKENGFNEQVSSKTLEEQQRILREKGDHESADLLDRKAAPKIDGLYRSPEMKERIREKIEQIERGEYNTPIEEMSHADRVIEMYARDLVVRQAARRIQQDRIKYNEAVQIERDEKEKQEIINSPHIVTADDVVDYLGEKKETLEAKIKADTEEYRTMKSKTIDEGRLRREILDKITENRYSILKKRYDRANEKYRNELAKDKEMLNSKSPNAREEYLAYTANLRNLKNEANRCWAEFDELRKDVQINHGEEMDMMLQEQIQGHEKEIEESRVLYGKINQEKRELEGIKKTLDSVGKLPPETILFSEELPKTLTRNDRIEGVMPIKKLEACPFKGNIYYIIDGEGTSVKAVKLNDDIIDGKVSVYEVERINDSENHFKVIGVKKSEETIKIFADKHTRKNPNSKVKNYNSANVRSAQATHTANNNMKCGTIANKIMNDKVKPMRVRWREKNDNKKTEMQLAEERMYQGWHPGIEPRH